MNAIESVYRSGFEWARLGLKVITTGYAQLVLNPGDPEHHEGNAAWYVSIEDKEMGYLQDIETVYAEHGLTCHHVVPHYSSDKTVKFLKMQNYLDSPAYGFMIEPYFASLPASYEFIPAESELDLYEKVYSLPGQRFAFPEIRSTLERLVAQNSLRLFSCRYNGQLVGRVGALRVSDGTLRLKSIFVSSAHRKRGVATVMLQHVSNIAKIKGLI